MILLRFAPLVICLYFSIRFFVLCVLAWKSRYWLIVHGKVTSSIVEWVYGEGISPGSESPRANIRYTFNVNGENYASSRISFHEFGGIDWKKNVNKLIDKYSYNAEVKVYYNPKNPKMCCLEPGIHWTNLAAWLLITFFTLGVFLQTTRQ